jgi:hypothetical protein
VNRRETANAQRATLFTGKRLSMNAPHYRAQYFGGPYDGVVVVATRLDRKDTWSMPVAAHRRHPLPRGCTPEVCRAVYKLSRTCHLIEHGTATIRFEYAFVGMEVVEPVTKRSISTWLDGLKNQLKCWFQSELWRSLPEGRPKRPGQAGRLLTCPGRGLGDHAIRATDLSSPWDAVRPSTQAAHS